MTKKNINYQLVLFILLLFFTIFLLCTFNKNISYYDEAYYIKLGKSLAEGSGYTEINLPGSYPHVAFPIIYPFILAIIWKIIPSFPSNLILMKIFQIFLCLVSVYVMYKYLVNYFQFPPFLAAGITAVSFLSFWVVFFARTATTEIPYFLASLSAIYFFRKYKGCEYRPYLLLTWLFIILSYGVRAVGFTLAISMILYLFMEKNWKMLCLFTTMLIPFIIFNAIKIITLTSIYGKNNILFNSYTGYKGFFDLQTLAKFIPTVIQENLNETISLFLQTILPYVNSEAYPYLSSLMKIFVLFLITFGIFIIGYLYSLIRKPDMEVIYMGIYLLLFIMVPAPIYRYLVPILPFMCIYYFRSLRSIILNLSYRLNSSITKNVGMSCLFVLMFTTIIHRTSQEIRNCRMASQFADKITGEVIKASDWLKKNSGENDLIACRFDPIFYLYSGRKTIRGYPMFVLSTYHSIHYRILINNTINPTLEALKKLNTKFMIYDDLLVGGAEGYFANLLMVNIINILGNNCKMVYSNDSRTLFIFKFEWERD